MFPLNYTKFSGQVSSRKSRNNCLHKNYEKCQGKLADLFRFNKNLAFLSRICFACLPKGRSPKYFHNKNFVIQMFQLKSRIL